MCTDLSQTSQAAEQRFDNSSSQLTSILITGGTGTLGNALASHLIEGFDFSRLVIYSRDELKQAEMAQRFSDSRIRFFLGDVRDRDRLHHAMQGIKVVVHAAALKRIDAVSYNPSEVIKTNVLGTMNVIDAAIDAGVKTIIFISTDKAVNAQNVYGASKLLAEGYAIASNAYGEPRGAKIVVVRYGNVFGSRGSVVDLFRRAIENGSRLSITDPACTRFVITKGQACDLIIKALGAGSGDILVPMLRSMKLTDLAEALSPGYPPEIVGMRPGGEKRHEQLITEEEAGRAFLRDGNIVIRSDLSFIKTDRAIVGLDQRISSTFRYTSESCPRMTLEELREILLQNGFVGEACRYIGSEAR